MKGDRRCNDLASLEDHQVVECGRGADRQTRERCHRELIRRFDHIEAFETRRIGDDAEDVCQESRTKFWYALEVSRWEVGHPRALYRTILRNSVIDHHRRRQRLWSLLERYGAQPTMPWEPPDERERIDYEALTDCVEALPPIYRQPIELFLAEVPGKVAAESLGILIDNYYARKHRAVAMIGDCYRQRVEMSGSGEQGV